MKHLTGVLPLFLLAAGIGAPTTATAAFADSICPEATQYVIELGQLKTTDPPSSIVPVAHAAASAYETCAKRKLADANVEPGVHYAYTRQAQFGIVEARALAALGKTAEAKTAAENSRRLAQDVVDWRRSSYQNGSVISSSDKDTRPSLYRDSAREIVAAANELLAKLSAPAAASPSTAPGPHR